MMGWVSLELHMLHLKIFRQGLCIAALMFCTALSLPAQTAKQPGRAVSTETQLVFQQGIAALKERNLDAARAAFEKVVRLSPANAEAHNLLGWVLLSLGQIDSAVVQYEKAIQLKPSFAEAHINLANALVQKRDLEGALREAETAARLVPNNADAHRIVGRVLSFQR